MRLLPDKFAVVIDIETTEVTLARARQRWPDPIDIAAVLVSSDLTVLETFQSLVCPEHLSEFTEFSEKFTGRTLDELKEANTWSIVGHKLSEFAGKRKIISWYMPNDYAILMQAYESAGWRWPLGQPTIDALSIAYAAAGEWGFNVGNSLAAWCNRLELSQESKRHTALEGALTCVKVLSEILAFGDEHVPDDVAGT